MVNSKVFTDWHDRHRDLFGRHMINLGHRFHELDLFADEALARLIDRTPRERCHVNTMDTAIHDPRSRREGVIKGLKGDKALEAVRTGSIWILLQDPAAIDPRYGALLTSIFDDIDRLTGEKTYRHKMTILISSPNIKVYYHSDIPGQTLWQVRGTKRVYVYPNSAPFLPQHAIEKIVMGEMHEFGLGYEPWFDDYAKVVDLEPGRMLHWPLNCPHRIDNADCMNVSFTTEHWTYGLRKSYATNYANGLIRRMVGDKPLSQSTEGPVFALKAGLAALHKKTGIRGRRESPPKVDFQVDPSAPRSVRTIEPSIPGT